MTREERNQLLADLRAAGVKSCDLDDAGHVCRVEFFPAAAPARTADEDRPVPPPQRTFDQKLFGPLGIDKPEAQG